MQQLPFYRRKKKAEVVTDNGYYSEPNLAEMFHRHFDFITLSKTNIKWIKPEIDKHMDEAWASFKRLPVRSFNAWHNGDADANFGIAKERASRKSGLSAGMKKRLPAPNTRTHLL